MPTRREPAAHGAVHQPDARCPRACSSLADPTLFPLRHSLEKNEVMDDLRAVFRDWKDTAERFQAETTTKLLPTRAEGRVLHFCSHTFNRGDAVVCISELTAQEFPGVFMGCNAVEAGLLLPDGTKCRIRLDHLRLGRLILKPAGDPDPVTARLLDSFRQPSFPPPTSDPPRPNASVTGYLPPRAAEIARERRHAALLVGRQAEAEVAAAAEAGMVPEHPTRHAAPADPAPPSQPPSPVQQPAPAPEHASVVPPAANSSSSSSSSSASFSEAGTADSAPPAPAVQAGLPPAVPPQLPPPAVTSSAASELADDEIRPGKRQRPDADASPAPQAPEAAPAPGDEHDGQAPAKRPREQADPHPAPPPDTASPLGGLAPAGEPPLPAEHAAPATEEPADPVGPPAAPEEPALGAAGAGPEPAITNAAAAPPAAEDAPSASVPAAETAPPADPTPAPAEPTPAPVEPAPQPGQDGAGAAPQ